MHVSQEKQQELDSTIRAQLAAGADLAALQAETEEARAAALGEHAAAEAALALAKADAAAALETSGVPSCDVVDTPPVRGAELALQVGSRGRVALLEIVAHVGGLRLCLLLRNMND